MASWPEGRPPHAPFKARKALNGCPPEIKLLTVSGGAPEVLNPMLLQVPRPHAEMARLPSAYTATAVTESEWPERERNSAPLSTSHILNVLSTDAEMARLPSAYTATAVTKLDWPKRERNSAPLSRSHTFSVWSPEAEMARLLGRDS